jgi:hypothetical protein
VIPLANDIQFNFKDRRVEVKRAAEDAIDAVLLEVSAELVSQTARNTPVDTGQLKGSWAANVTNDGDKYTATIGSPLEYAIWQEFGTGEYALKGDGRKGGWAYEDPKTGKRIFTFGNRPRRMFWNAFTSLKDKMIKRIQDTIGARLSE